MSRVVAPYSDLESAVMDLISGHFPELAGSGADFRVGKKYPPDLVNRLPFVRIRDIGGGNDDGITDTGLIDVDVFHTTDSAGKKLTLAIQALLLSYPHVVGATVIDKVRTAMRPHDVPWDDERIARYYGSYSVSARR